MIPIARYHLLRSTSFIQCLPIDASERYPKVLGLIDHHIRHSRLHVVEVVTVVKPVARVIGVEFDIQPLHGLHDDGILPYPPLLRQRGIHHLEEKSEQVHGMGHHAAIKVRNAHPFVLSHDKGLHVGVDLAIDCPEGRVHAPAQGLGVEPFGRF